DGEHSAVDLPATQVLFQAMRAGNPECAPLVRLAGNRYEITKQYLDAGAQGVIAPLINSADEARELVRAAKYPPEGARGVGYCRANAYGADFDRAVLQANEQTLVCVQIEHIDAVNRVDEILSTPGVDAAFIGPYDLTASMGITGRFDHPEAVAAMARVFDACRRHGVAPGVHVVPPDPEQVASRIREGYRLVAFSLDITMLNVSCGSGLQKIRGLLSE
ncbi:MAG: 2,4-dihydroxyhept-2-ene-1,7-dioic acid aldolase, partial [Planctomycetes bacterium]|nr:2,4-dihydroxyhept-2-ene-1,7-dioic acid aldolase [Planctomycetota bacterium]